MRPRGKAFAKTTLAQANLKVRKLLATLGRFLNFADEVLPPRQGPQEVAEKQSSGDNSHGSNGPAGHLTKEEAGEEKHDKSIGTDAPDDST